MTHQIIKALILFCVLTVCIGNVYAQNISPDWSIDTSNWNLVPNTTSYILTNPSIGNYVLNDTLNNTFYSGTNASYAINFCTQKTNTYLHILPGYYRDNGVSINIFFNSSSILYGDGASTIIAIKMVSSVLGSTGGVWGNFTMSGS
jgi:hypothetical protein